MRRGPKGLSIRAVLVFRKVTPATPSAGTTMTTQLRRPNGLYGMKWAGLSGHRRMDGHHLALTPQSNDIP